jgi:hypothetical protein
MLVPPSRIEWAACGEVEWPHRIRRLLWTKNIRNVERFLVAVFAWVNGLRPELLSEWANLMGLCRDNYARKHFEFLFKAFSEGRYMYNKSYSWNVVTRRYCTCGHVGVDLHKCSSCILYSLVGVARGTLVGGIDILYSWE